MGIEKALQSLLCHRPAVDSVKALKGSSGSSSSSINKKRAKDQPSPPPSSSSKRGVLKAFVKSVCSLRKKQQPQRKLAAADKQSCCYVYASILQDASKSRLRVKVAAMSPIQDAEGLCKLRQLQTYELVDHGKYDEKNASHYQQQEEQQTAEEHESSRQQTELLQGVQEKLQKIIERLRGYRSGTAGQRGYLRAAQADQAAAAAAPQQRVKGSIDNNEDGPKSWEMRVQAAVDRLSRITELRGS